MERYLYKAKTAKIVSTYNNAEDGVWVKGYLRCDTGKWTIYQFEFDRADYVFYEIDPDTICQCTGLKDKNDNLIYENDILDGFTYPYMLDGVHNYYAEVCWCTNVPGFGIYTQKYPESKVSGISAGMTELMEDWCPLKELPDETHNDEYMDEYCDGYDNGWNSLRKKILGEDEENK